MTVLLKIEKPNRMTFVLMCSYVLRFGYNIMVSGIKRRWLNRAATFVAL